MAKDQFVQQLQLTSVSMVFDALFTLGFQPDKFVMSDIRPMFEVKKAVVGLARTMKFEISREFPTTEDLHVARKGIDDAKPGEFLVQDGSGFMGAFFGDIVALACKNRGMVGALVDGAIRDVLEIKAMGLPVFAKGVTPLGGSLYFRPVAINTRVNCGGIQVDSGDIIIADNDGVIAIPQEISARVGEALKSVSEKEEIAVQSLKAGKSLVDSYPKIQIGDKEI